MPKATQTGGKPKPIEKCTISGSQTIKLYALPDISDQKSAVWNDEPIMGRTMPFKTYARSDNRTISMQLHFYVFDENSVDENLGYLRYLESLVYPQQGNGDYPFTPPEVVRIKCGKLLGNQGVCCVLKSYSVKFPTNIPWSDVGDSYVPYKFDVDTTWDAVYPNDNLPNANSIINL